MSAVATFDLVTEETAERASVRRAVRDTAPIGPRFVRQVDDRSIEDYVITIKHATVMERLRLRDLWVLSRWGTLPLLYVHPQDGAVNVLIVDNPLRTVHQSGRFASLEVRLRKALGA